MRLIYADALIAELEKDEDRFDREAEDGKQNPQNCTVGYAEAMWSRANGIRDAIISIYDAPTVDAVEVRDVAKILCDMFGDSCACNYNGIDEWLPYVCKYEKSGECPSPNDENGCWMEFLRNKFGENDGKTV